MIRSSLRTNGTPEDLARQGDTLALLVLGVLVFLTLVSSISQGMPLVSFLMLGPAYKYAKVAVLLRGDTLGLARGLRKQSIWYATAWALMALAAPPLALLNGI